jgi:hypothetical protein
MWHSVSHSFPAAGNGRFGSEADGSRMAVRDFVIVKASTALFCELNLDDFQTFLERIERNRSRTSYLVDRYSERKENAAELSARVILRSI